MPLRIHVDSVADPRAAQSQIDQLMRRLRKAGHQMRIDDFNVVLAPKNTIRLASVSAGNSATVVRTNAAESASSGTLDVNPLDYAWLFRKAA